MSEVKKPETISEYIAQCDPKVGEKLLELQQVIKDAAPPETIEKISWQMPTFAFHGNLVHFAANKNHIGFYPGASGVAFFLEQTPEYQCSKGAVQFPLDRPIPFDLVQKTVKFRAQENLKLYEEKQKR